MAKDRAQFDGMPGCGAPFQGRTATLGILVALALDVAATKTSSAYVELGLEPR